MRRLKTSLTPNQTRFLYDIIVSGLASAFVIVYERFLLGNSIGLALIFSPAVLIFFNWTLGIFSRHRVASAQLKLKLLSASVFLSALVLAVLSGHYRPCLLWLVLVWSPIVLPRVFLNLNVRHKTGIIPQAIRGRGPVLVVGGGGYIGSHVVEQLLKERFAVRVLDRFIYGSEALKDFADDPRLEIVEGDVTDIMKLATAMEKVSAVVHLAGLVGDPACSVDQGFTRHANVISTRMLKEIAISLECPRFVFASSCSVYGASDTKVDELSALNPVSLYAHTKIDSEKELLSCIDESFCVSILRFATVFGHSRRPRFDLVANLFAAQAFVDGKITLTGEDQWRPFVHVKDLARAIVAVLKAPEERVRGQIFNVGDDKLNMTIGQLAEMVKEIVSKERPVEIVRKKDVLDRRNYLVSFVKIKRLLGFEASTSMQQGLEELVLEFKEGRYKDYRGDHYSNLEMTKKALQDFRDPLQSSRLYRPLSDDVPPEPRVANV